MRHEAFESTVHSPQSTIFRALALAVFYSFCLLPSAFAQSVVTPTWHFQDYSLNSFGPKTVIVTPLRAVSNNSNIWVLGDPRRGVTTNSSFTTNLLNGSYYRVELWSGYQTYALTNFFDTNVTGAVDGGDPRYVAFNTNLDRGVYAYSQAGADARFLAKVLPSVVGYVPTAIDTNGNYVWGPGGSGGSATNAYQSQTASSGLTMGTNGFIYTFGLNTALQGWAAITSTAFSNVLQNQITANTANITSVSNQVGTLGSNITNNFVADNNGSANNLTASGTFSGAGTALTLDAGNLTQGIAPASRLGSGTANTTTYLRGDNQWIAPPFDPAGSATAATNSYPWENTMFVSTSGSDTTGNGTSGNPFATLQKAVNAIGQIGTIEVRGGDYDGTVQGGLNLSGKKISIVGYNNERPKFWFSAAVPASAFVSLSNGIYTAVPSQTFTNYLMANTNTSSAYNTGFHPQGWLLWQTNAPYGSNTADPLNYWSPLYLSYFGETNRCEFTPLGQASGVNSMVNSNAWWCYTNGLLYVKFAVSNVPGTIIVSSTNLQHTIAVSGDSLTDVTFENIETYGAYSAFTFTHVGNWHIRHCLVGFSTFENDYVNNATVDDTEYVGCNAGVNFWSDYFPIFAPQAFLRMSRCWIHDYTGDNGGVRISEELYADIEKSVCYGGTNAEWGWISDGGHVDLWNCVGVIDNKVGTAPFQMGDAAPLGHNSYMGLHGCYAYGAGDCVQIGNPNNNFEAWNSAFYSGTGIAVDVQDNSASNSAKLHNCVGLNAAGTTMIANGTDPTRYVVDSTVLGGNLVVNGYVQASGGTDAALVSQTKVRGNQGYRIYYKTNRLQDVIDANGFYFNSTNNSLPSVAPFAGASVLWNSNGVHTYLVQASPGSTTWAVTNDITATAAGGGTVTSVGLSAPPEFTVSGSPVTSSGTLGFTRTAGATANHFAQNDTNIAILEVTNTLAVGGGFTIIDATNVVQVNTLGGARKVLINTNGDVYVNGSLFIGNQAAVTANQLLSISTTAPLATNQYAYFNGDNGTTNLGSTLNGIWWTNVTGTNVTLDTSTLSPTSNATNYSDNLAPGAPGTHIIYGANTNINLTLTGTNLVDAGRTIFVDNSTSSVNCNLTFTFTYRTNKAFSATVSNGWVAYFNFHSPAGNGTVNVNDAGRMH